MLEAASITTSTINAAIRDNTRAETAKKVR